MGNNIKMNCFFKYVTKVLEGIKWRKMTYEERKQYNIILLRKRGIVIGENTDIIDTTFDTNFPFLITIGNDCIITGATILCHDASHILFSNRVKIGKVTVGNRCFIGMGAIVLPGVRIGDDCVIGSNSTVTKSVADDSVMVGSPARFIGKTSIILHRLEAGVNCKFIEGVYGNFRTRDELYQLKEKAKKMLD